MENSCIYQFFNNASVATLLSVAIGLFFARHIYQEQKGIDRKIAAENKLVEASMLLEEHCKAVNQIIDRLANTYKTIIANADLNAQQKFIESSLPNEINIAVEVLMYKIPEDTSKIESIISLYYSENEFVKNANHEVFSELKKWHDFVQMHATGKSGQKFDLNKRVSEIPELSLVKLNESIKKLTLNLRK